MNLRLCDKLNDRFIPKIVVKKYTHESSKVWSIIEKSFLSMAFSNSQPLCVSICFDIDGITLTSSDGYTEKIDITLQGIQDAIPRAKSEGLKVDFDFSDEDNVKIFSFTFTPSNC